MRARTSETATEIPPLSKRTQFDQLAIVTLSLDSGESDMEHRDPFEKGGGNVHTFLLSNSNHLGPLGRHAERAKAVPDRQQQWRRRRHKDCYRRFSRLRMSINFQKLRRRHSRRPKLRCMYSFCDLSKLQTYRAQATDNRLCHQKWDFRKVI